MPGAPQPLWANIAYNAKRIPTDGKGTTAAALTAGNATYTETTMVISTGTFASIVVGGLITTSGGFWGTVLRKAGVDTVVVRRWHRQNTPSQDGKCVPTGTYEAWPACIWGTSRKTKIKQVLISTGIALATLTITDVAGASITPVNALFATALNDHDFGDGLEVDGPFFITPSVATVIGTCRFTLE